MYKSNAVIQASQGFWARVEYVNSISGLSLYLIVRHLAWTKPQALFLDYRNNENEQMKTPKLNKTDLVEIESRMKDLEFRKKENLTNGY